jgi:hypothetical protein
MVRIALAGGGSYEIEQTLMGAGSAEVATRRFPARFEAGQEYEWSLATVVSEVETPAGAPAGTEAAAHE